MSYLKEFETNLSYHFSEVLESPLARPYWVFISLSHRCNNNCQMCGVIKVLKGYELSPETANKALDDIAGWQRDCTVVITGGEPFLRKDIFQIIEHSASNKIKTEVVSNGSLIDEELASKIISSGLANIAVSLDGAGPKTHDLIRREGSFKEALGSLRHLVKAKERLGGGPQISAWTTIMKENLSELSDIAPLVKDLGVECLVYHPVIIAQDDMQNTDSNAPFWIRAQALEVLKEQIDKIISYQSKHGLVAFLHDPYLWLKYFEGTLTREDWRCNPFVFMNIGPDGETRSCGLSFGNIKEAGLNHCLNTEEAYKARRLMKVCEKPCLQTCWGWPEANSLSGIVDGFISKIRESDLSKEDKRENIKQALNILTGYEEALKERVDG